MLLLEKLVSDQKSHQSDTVWTRDYEPKSRIPLNRTNMNIKSVSNVQDSWHVDYLRFIIRSTSKTDWKICYTLKKYVLIFSEYN